jgi:hypothetical protein
LPSLKTRRRKVLVHKQFSLPLFLGERHEITLAVEQIGFRLMSELDNLRPGLEVKICYSYSVIEVVRPKERIYRQAHLFDATE